MTRTYYDRPEPKSPPCDCPKNHAHTYDGPCEWARRISGGKSPCACDRKPRWTRFGAWQTCQMRIRVAPATPVADRSKIEWTDSTWGFSGGEVPR
jgi:hypothetical protein